MPPSCLVSIIIPCYNQGSFLSEAISSALNQSYKPVEVIVVDDGSTDSTSSVAKTYDRVRYVRQANRGVTSARNLGITMSRGTYVVFLDADDRLLPHAVETGIKSLEGNLNYALTFGTFHRIDAKGDKKSGPHSFELKPYGFQDFLERNLIGNPGVALYRKCALLSVQGFDPTNPAAGDYDLYLRITKLYPITCHIHTVLEYRRHGRNMSDDPAVMLSGCLTALRKQWKIIKADPSLKSSYYRGVSYWKQYYGEQLVFKLYEHLALRSWRKLIGNVCHILIHYPERMTRSMGNKCRYLYKKD